MSKILVADDERAICAALGRVVEREGHQALVAGTGHEALALVAQEQPTVVLLDVQMPGMDGLEVLRRIKSQWPQTRVIVMTAYGTVQTAMEAMREGAFEYLGKPLELQRLRPLLRRALQHAQAVPAAQQGTAGARADTSDGFELIGQGPAMQEVFKLMSLVTNNDLTVLITGESGVGKELVARGIHAHSPRCDQPFVAVNCAAIPPNLIESELFGHERGAFTGAAGRRHGRFETAGRGTLFLDEIGELPTDLQSKLLRVLQERRFERLGSNVPIALQARVLAATNRDLNDEVATGRFREDLFHRINLVRLQVPPLRKRPEDIPVLGQHFLRLANQELRKDIQAIDTQALAALRAYHWPGNVRELQNVIRKSVLLTQGDRLTAADLELPGDACDRAPAGVEAPNGHDLLALRQAARKALRARSATEGPAINVFQSIAETVERELIAEALRMTDGNQVAASRLLGLSRTTLRKKMDPASG